MCNFKFSNSHNFKKEKENKWHVLSGLWNLVCTSHLQRSSFCGCTFQGLSSNSDFWTRQFSFLSINYTPLFSIFFVYFLGKIPKLSSTLPSSVSHFIAPTSQLPTLILILMCVFLYFYLSWFFSSDAVAIPV